MSNTPNTSLRNGELVRHGPYPEFTFTAVVVGWIIGSLIAVSISYAALVLGFSIEGSELAAILGWGVLRGMLRRTSILENNINQTIASAVNGASSGIMFSVPAILILSAKPQYEALDDFNRMWMILSCIAGCFIGLAFVVPLRKQMIDFNRLAYPGGIAVAAVLKSPGAGIRKAILMIGAAVLSGLFYYLMSRFLGDHPDYTLGQNQRWPTTLNLVFSISLLTFGVGFLSGKGGFWFGAGGFICYWILAPLLFLVGPDSTQSLMNPTVQRPVIGTSEREQITRSVERATTLTAEARAELDRLGLTTAATIGQIELFLDSPLLPPIANVIKSISDQAAATNADGDRQKLERLAATLEGLTNATARTAAQGVLPNLTAEKATTLRDLPGGESRAMMDTIDQLEVGSDDKNRLHDAVGAKAAYYDVPEDLRRSLFRPTGIGMLVGAALGGLVVAFPLVFSAFASLYQAGRRKKSGEVRDEPSLKTLMLIVLLGLALLVVIVNQSTGEMTWKLAATMAMLGTIWVWIAGVIVAECVGRTNWSPLSGMTLVAVTLLVFISSKSGLTNSATLASSMMMGAAICLAVSQASDMMLDLKAGYLVGAIPKRQVLAQYVGAWLGPCLVIFLMFVLHRAYGLGEDGQLPAPQATALATVMEGIIDDNFPAHRYLAGAGLGLLLAISGLGGIGVMVALGFYMPFNIVLTYSIGCVLRIIVDKVAGVRFSHNVGIPIAAGLIVGEALVQVGQAVYKVVLTTFF